MTTPFVRADVAALLELLETSGRPPIETLEPQQARAGSNAARAAMEVELGDLAVIREFAIPGPAGPIRARLFDAEADRGPGNLIIYYHGGGFVIGDLDSHAPLCADLSRMMGLPVVSVDYRLAPEYPFPAGPEDAMAAARWLADHGSDVGLAAERLVLMGDSAGANLALLAGIDQRDAPARVSVAALGLIYPVTGPVPDAGSGREFANGYFLTRAVMDYFDRHYQPQLGDWRHETELRGTHGLAPTVVLTAALDPLRDQGRALAAAVAAQGINSVYLEAEGNIHGFATMRRMVPSAQIDIERLCAAMRLLIN